MSKLGWSAGLAFALLGGCSSESVIGDDEALGASPQAVVTALSCEQRCEQVLTSPGPKPFSCSCEANCVSEGNCCDDAAVFCPAVSGGVGCSASCGGRSPDGCYCDERCEAYGDCCGDHRLFCADQRLLAPGSNLEPVGLYADPAGRAHFGLNKGPITAPVGADLYRTEGDAMWISQSFSGAVRITDVKGNGADVWTGVRFTDSIMSGGVTITAPGTHVLLLRRDYEDTPRATVVGPASRAISEGLTDQLAVDGVGNAYLLSSRAADGLSVVTSYSITGALRWQRTLPVAGLGDLAFGGSSVFIVLRSPSGEEATLTAYALKGETGVMRWSRVVATGAGGTISDVVADATGFVITGSMGVLNFAGVGEVFCSPTDAVGCSPGNGAFLASFTQAGATRFAQPLVARVEGGGAGLTDLALPHLALEPGTGRIIAAASAREHGEQREALGYFHADGEPCWLSDFPAGSGTAPWIGALSIDPGTSALRVLGWTGAPTLLGAPVYSAPSPKAFVLNLPAPPND